MSDFEKYVDEQIRKAMESGELEGLPGYGKPLNLERNPNEDPAWRVAFHALKSNGLTLHWIQMRKDIENDIQQAIDNLERTWYWYRSLEADHPERQLARQSWEQSEASFLEECISFNERILSYNVQVPSPQFSKQQVQPEKILEKVQEHSPD